MKHEQRPDTEESCWNPPAPEERPLPPAILTRVCHNCESQSKHIKALVDAAKEIDKWGSKHNDNEVVISMDNYLALCEALKPFQEGE